MESTSVTPPPIVHVFFHTLLTKQFSPKDTFFDAPYPNIVASIPDANLIKMRCSDYYAVFNDSRVKGLTETIKQGDTYKTISLTDPKQQEIVKHIQQQYPNMYLETYQACQTEDNIMIVSFDLSKSGFGKDPLHTMYIGTVKVDNTVQAFPITSQNVYYRCTKPLLLTTANNLYYECHFGDATLTGLIYQINLTTKLAKQIYSCTDATPDYKTVCT